MNIAQRKLLMGFLVISFVVQTVLVYSDSTADQFAPLSPLAKTGREIYHGHNCYTCHQIYGFGGFLGPDLTNVTQRVDRERFDQILTTGSEKMQMPAYKFSPAQIDALVAYFENINATGIGQAQRSPPPAPAAIDKALEDTVTSHPPTEVAARGFELFRTRGCVACHRVLYNNTLGMLTAPDLSTATTRLTDEEIDVTLEKGRNAMPPSGLPQEDRAAMTQWMHWLAENRKTIESNLGPAGERPVPWWEFGEPEAKPNGEQR